MWGNILLDTYNQSNYNFSFPNENSTILLQLIQWQYWWWFWFTYFLVLYYVLFLRLLSVNILKFNPSLPSSFRAHGKWGDFIICVVPISWCTNILTNSNFILRMLEWQMETSLLTIRVRGKQWYWVYKIELKELLNVVNFNKNLGKNLFLKSNNTVNYDYLNLLNLRFSNGWVNMFWDSNFLPNLNNYTDYFSVSKVKSNYVFNRNVFSLDFSMFLENYNIGGNSSLFNFFFPFSKKRNTLVLTDSVKTINNFYSSFNYNNVNRYFKFSNISNNITNVNNLNTGNLDTSNYIKLGSHSYSHVYLVLKQKRANLRNVNMNFSFNSLSKHNTLAGKSNWNYLFLKTDNFNEVISQTKNKRLLRTKRILILPTNVNITVITNSFDVIHSWYIPGLGIKLDCVPGRSTHHNLHIQNVGFYYGQCAEICGRYHHHMPIRICSVNMSHFLVWWSHSGVPMFFNNNTNLNLYSNYVNRNFNF